MLNTLLTWEHRDSRPIVLFITNMWPDAERPAYGIFVKRQIDSLREHGLRCDVLYVRGYRGPHAYVVAVIFLALMRQRFRRRYRLVHAHAGETALAAGALRGHTMLASYCGDDILGYARVSGTIPLRSRLRRFAIRREAQLFTATITKSQEMARALPVAVRTTNYVVPNGVNASLFRPMPRLEARKRLGWSTAEQVVLFAATRPYEVRKRLDLAQAAVAHAERELGPIRLAVPENQSPDSIPVMMNAANCLLLTSMSEGSPNVVKEAIMCNLPVVSTDVGDVREMLSGVAPSAICKADSTELGNSLVEVLRLRVRSNGRQQREGLSDSIIARQVLKIYERVGITEPRTRMVESS